MLRKCEKIYFPLLHSILLSRGFRCNLPLGQNEDLSITDEILTAINPYLRNGARPVFTKFKVDYQCHNCHMLGSVGMEWTGNFRTVPMLNFPSQRGRVGVGQLLSSFLDLPYHVNCQTCNQVTVGTMTYQQGLYTILTINRLGYLDNQGNYIPMLRTPVSDVVGNGSGHQLLNSGKQRLICICIRKLTDLYL